VQSLLQDSPWVLQAAVVATIGVVAGLVVHAAGMFVARRVAPSDPHALGRIAVRRMGGPLRLLLPLLGLVIALTVATIPTGAAVFIRRPLGVAVIASVAWLLVRFSSVVEELLYHRFNVQVADNLLARKARTQIDILHRIVVFVVIVVAFAAALMLFDRVRQFGTSILASAGIAGIIVGLAAQRSLGNVLAGLQVAFSQPFRLDDVVVVEGEWGRIEEITLTYVVVKIWDERRLVLPISYFIEKPFQNWTRVSAELLGTVFLYVDYTVPVEPIRQRLKEILEGSEKWDKRVCNVQVTNAGERTVELRALMSARNSPEAWDLRCLVREELLRFLQERYPQGLPRVRAELQEDRETRNGRREASPRPPEERETQDAGR
jgi:small-conductance mechanosensitive channel